MSGAVPKASQPPGLMAISDASQGSGGGHDRAASLLALRTQYPNVYPQHQDPQDPQPTQLTSTPTATPFAIGDMGISQGMGIGTPGTPIPPGFGNPSSPMGPPCHNTMDSMMNQVATAVSAMAALAASQQQGFAMMQEQMKLQQAQLNHQHAIQAQMARDARVLGPAAAQQPQQPQEPPWRTANHPPPPHQDAHHHRGPTTDNFEDFPEPLKRLVGQCTRDWVEHSKRRDRAATKVKKVSADIDLMVDSAGKDLVYPSGTKEWKASHSFTEMDEIWHQSAEKDITFSSTELELCIRIPSGSTRRAASQVLHHSMNIVLKKIELESITTHFQSAHRMSSIDKLKEMLVWEINTYCEEENKKHRAAMLEIGILECPNKVSFDQNRVEAFIVSKLVQVQEASAADKAKKTIIEQEALLKQRKEENAVMEMAPQELVQEAIKTIVENILEKKTSDAAMGTSTSTSSDLEGVLQGLTALLAKNGGGPSVKGPTPNSKKQQKKAKKGKGKGGEEMDTKTKKPTGAGRGSSMEQEDPPWRSGPPVNQYINKKDIKDIKDTAPDLAERTKDKNTINHLNQLLANLQGKGPKPDQDSERGKGSGKFDKGKSKVDKGKGKGKTKDQKGKEKGKFDNMKGKGKGHKGKEKGKYTEPMWYQATEGGLW